MRWHARVLYMFSAVAIAAVVVLTMVGVYHMASGKDLAAKQQLIGAPWADIGDAPTGVDIRLSGRLALFHGESLSAPLSGRTCSAWRIIIEEEYNDGDSSSWKKVVDEHEAVDFLLIDDTGRARVEAMHITLIADYDAKGGKDTFRDVPEELAAILTKRGVRESSWWSRQRNFRYRESALEVDELVTVAGCGRWENDPSQKSGYRGTAKIFRMGPLGSGLLVVGDDPALAPDHKRSI